MPERCAPTTAMVISPARVIGASGVQERLPHSERAERQFGLRMHDAAEACEHRVAAGARQEGHAIGRAVAGERDRHREAAQIEQVHEIGIGAEIAVERDRVGLDLRLRVGGRHRRHHQRIEAREHLECRAAKRGEPVEGAEGFGGGRLRPAHDDFAGDRMHLVRVLLDEGADRGIAFRHPGAFVKQPRGFQQRENVDLLDLRAHVAQEARSRCGRIARCRHRRRTAGRSNPAPRSPSRAAPCRACRAASPANRDRSCPGSSAPAAP